MKNYSTLRNEGGEEGYHETQLDKGLEQVVHLKNSFNESDIRMDMEEDLLLGKEKQKKHLFHHLKIGFLSIITIVLTGVYAAYPWLEYETSQFSVSLFQPETLNFTVTEYENPYIVIAVTASIFPQVPEKQTNNLIIVIENIGTGEQKKLSWVVPTLKGRAYTPESENKVKTYFSNQSAGNEYKITIKSNTFYSVPGQIGIHEMPEYSKNSQLIAALILIFVYVLIIFELVHRTVAAMIGALASITVMAVINQKQTMEEIISWLDYDTLTLLFGMMVLVSILCETGFFDWIALMAYKIAKGKTWPLITTLCIFSAVISAFLDNVTTILLLTPVTIRLCEVLDIDPKHVLMAEVLFSNVGGTATGIGDPPNVLIIGNNDIQLAGIGFGEFTAHMFFGSSISCFAAYGLIRFMYRKKESLRSTDPPGLAALSTEAKIWKRQIWKLNVATREENTLKALLLEKVAKLEHDVRKRKSEHKENEKRGFKIQVEELAKIYYIKDKILLAKCLFVLTLVVMSFFLQSFVSSYYLTVGWIPVIGSLWLLVLVDFHDLDAILHRVEWTTLMFFSALFVMMEALQQLGLIDIITGSVKSFVISIPESSRLTVAIIVILWASALASSFIDNIPYTTAMIPVIINISSDPNINLPLEPLIYSLAFGACFGGNGTLIGASANVVCASIAETHGHGFSFKEFFKVGFPMMVVTTVVAMVYLLFCHVAIGWN